MGEIIPFLVWKFPFAVLKINFETLGTKKYFDQRSRSGRNNSISCWKIPFPVLKINFVTEQMRNIL